MKKLWNMHELIRYASQNTGISEAACKELLEKGWTLRLQIKEPVTWLSPIYQVNLPAVEEVTSRGVKVKDKNNEKDISRANRTVRDFMHSDGLQSAINSRSDLKGFTINESINSSIKKEFDNPQVRADKNLG